MTASSPPDSGQVRWGRTIAAYAGLASIVAVLLPAGHGSLSVPLGSGRDLVAWLEATPPPVIATAGLRLVALAACGYLALALTATVVAGLTPRRRLGLLVGQLAPTAVRRALVCGARSGLATTVALGWWAPFTASPAGATPAAYRTTSPSDDPSLHTATMSRLPAAPGSTSTRGAPPVPPVTDTTPVTGPGDLATRQQPRATATMVHLGSISGTAAQSRPSADGQAGPTSPSEPATETTAAGSPGATTAALPHGTTTTQPPDGSGSASERPPTPAPPSTTQPASENPPPPAPTRTGDDEWIVGPGESFWSIAEEALRDARDGAQPEDAEISRYWHRLIAANHDRLTAPDNPDLLHVGQSLVLPPPG